MRPPHRSRASRIVTCLPARANSHAAISPAAPAPTTTTCFGSLGDIGCTSADLRAFGGHDLPNGGAREHASSMLDDARQPGGVDPVAFEPGADRKEVRIADRVPVADNPRPLQQLVLDQLEAFGHVRRYLALHRRDRRF